jgi:TetR/AcrR family transcriptional regulator, cholesterol catabolism regulator
MWGKRVGLTCRTTHPYNKNKRSFSFRTAAIVTRAVRSDNRLQELLDAASALFAQRGYAATSMRDIALAVQMLPGSVYYHFTSKEELLVAVYEAGVAELASAVRTAVAAADADPWRRLEAACRAHLETVLRKSDYAQVLTRVHPEDVPAVADRLRALRAGYEEKFRSLVASLPLPAGTDRRTLRLMLLGALNWARVWFDPEGRQTPSTLASRFVSFLKEAQDA